MSLRRLAVAAMLAVSAAGFAQDAGSVLLTYQRNFVRSSLATKLELLKEAGKTGSAADMGPLYETALKFVLDNAGLLQGDAQLRDLALLGVRKAGESGWSKAAEETWSLFQVYSGDDEIRAAAITAYARTGKGVDRTVTDIVSFLSSQLTLFKSGMQPEYPAFEAAVDALGLLGDPRAYPALFAAYVASPNAEIKAKAAGAVAAVQTGLRAFLEEAIKANPALEKAAALDLGLDSGLAPEDRGSLAEAALTAALSWTGDAPVEQASIRQLRVKAIRVIGELKWQRASPLAVRHFRLLMADYTAGKGAAGDLLEAVSCLGAMGSTEAAQALALQLQLINAQTEQGRPYDAKLLLAIVEALGALGDKTAFDYLLYISYLQYPEAIKSAAREALQKLKW